MRLKILITVLLNNKTFVNELVSELATLSYLVTWTLEACTSASAYATVLCTPVGSLSIVFPSKQYNVIVSHESLCDVAQSCDL